jgi:hypothetical protein
VAHLGGAVTQLTNDREPDAAPAWSPDGARIAYSRAGELWTLAATGGGAAALLPDAATPDWSADGTRIAFERDGDAFAVAAGGGAPVLLARPPAATPPIRRGRDRQRLRLPRCHPLLPRRPRRRAIPA